MKLYYLQCKQFQFFQFVVFGKVYTVDEQVFSQHCRNIFQAKMAQPPRKIGPYAYGASNQQHLVMKLVKSF